MRTGDKEFFILGAVGIFVVIVYAYLTGKLESLGLSLPSYSFGQPGMAVPAWTGGSLAGSTVPGFADPGLDTTMPPNNITINVPPLAFGTIAPYFPLFGFVGVDSGMIFQ